MICALQIILALASLEELPHGRPEGKRDAQLDAYVERFYAEAEARGVTLAPATVLVTADDPNDAAERGACINGQSYVRATWWDDVTRRAETFELADLEAEAIVFHELGHCVLGLGHDNSTTPEGTAASIMNERNWGGPNYQTNRTKMIDELFQ